jgi:WD40 repeat protein
MTESSGSARWARVDDACDRFEQAWRRGERPGLEKYLHTGHDSDLSLLFPHLLALDLGYRGDAGEQPTPEEYRQRFPHLTEIVEQVFQEKGWKAERDGQAEGAALSPGIIRALGDFELLEEIGRGGMGIVYRARQRSADRDVALKVIKTDWLLDLPESLALELRQRFLREVATTAKLEHPHIVPLYTAGEVDGQPYYAMRYVLGRSLSRVVEEDGPMDNDRAARYLERVARAVHYAHGNGILHRDLKPRNILLGADGEPLVVDFGLAKLVGEAGGATHSGQLLGTPSYMSPEQTLDASSVTPASDVYSLGATLYDLLVGRPPFQAASALETINQVQSEEPVPLHRLNRAIPSDLDAICLKCLEKEPHRRYPSAEALADDLRNYLERRPTKARPVGHLGRIDRWCRRFPGRAVSLAGALVLLLALAGATLMWAIMADAHARALRREVSLQQMQHLRSSDHGAGWRERAWPVVREAAAIRKDAALRNGTASLLAGLDARLQQQLEGGGSTLAFDERGERLLIGGLNDNLGIPREPARLWDLRRNEVIGSGQPGEGPVQFTPDGTPLQFVAEDRWSLVVWDLASGRAFQRFRLAAAGREPLTNETLPALALSPDASLAAASFTAPDGKVRLLVWDMQSARVVRASNLKATALAFTPDNRLLAAGEADGTITVWRLREPEPLARLRRGRMEIHALDFVRDPVRPDGPADHEDSWLLAAGELGGTVNVWDVRTGLPRIRCTGAPYDILGVAFSPDGTLVAGAGYGQARLWDVSTGQLVLTVTRHHKLQKVVFSRDGSRLAISSVLHFDNPGTVEVWEMEHGRGLRHFRGLSARVSMARFSPDGRWLLGLAENWQAGIWDMATGRLRRIFDLPPGVLGDNAGFALSPDGNRFAFAAGEHATLWEVTSGKRLASWRLPMALQDQIAFPTEQSLLLFRMETLDGKAPPFGTERARHPRVCRVRDLLGLRPVEPLVETRDFRGTLFRVLIPDDGRFFVLDGRLALDRASYATKAFDTRTGAGLWSHEERRLTDAGAWCCLDPLGSRLSVSISSDTGEFGPSVLIDTERWQQIATLDAFPNGLSPRAALRVDSQQAQHLGWAISRGLPKAPFLIVGIGVPSSSIVYQFDRTGDLFTWGNADGTVTVCSLVEVQSQLGELGLGW